MTTTDTNFYEKFIRACIAMPIGASLPIPERMLPYRKDDESYDYWDDIEELQMDIRDLDVMYSRYGMPKTEGLALVHAGHDWRVYHIAFHY